jgi:outer membrane protein
VTVRFRISSLPLFLIFTGLSFAQSTPAGPAHDSTDVTKGWGTLAHGYRVPDLNPVRLTNSTRLNDLLRDGKLYLSLQEAFALALENNLDIDLERYVPRLAETDLLRAKSGNFLRGIPTSVREGPAGVGGPQVGQTPDATGTLIGGAAPTLNSLTGTATETDVSIIGSIPLSTGPAVPNLDPTVVASASWNHESVPQNSTFLSNLLSLNSDTTVGSLGIQKGFLTGGTASLSWNNTYQRINDPLYSLNPATYSNLNLTVTQPLLRGFGWHVNGRYIQIAKNNKHVSDLVFQQQVIGTVYAVSRLYWDLVSLNEDLQVREEAVTSAKRLLDDSKASLAEGTMAQIDVTRAEAEVAHRERDRIVAQSLVRQQGAVLLDFLTRTTLSSGLENVQVVPTDHVNVPQKEDVGTLDDLVAQAFKNRPELSQAQLQLQNSRISLKGSRNAVLPQLDLIASVQNNALVGDPNSFTTSSLGAVPGNPVNPYFVGSYSEGQRQIFHRNFPDYGAGVSLNIPLGNRAARADAARDQLQVRQQEIRLRQLQKEVRLQVLNALIALQQARETYAAAEKERIYEQQSVEAESERLGVGASTNYQVIQYQRDLTSARSAEVSALSSYAEAKAALQRAAGTTLQENRVMLDEARTGAVQRPVALPPPQ